MTAFPSFLPTWLDTPLSSDNRQIIFFVGTNEESAKQVRYNLLEPIVVSAEDANTENELNKRQFQKLKGVALSYRRRRMTI